MFRFRAFNTKSIVALALVVGLLFPQTLGIGQAAETTSRGPHDPVEIEQFADSLMTNRFLQSGAILTVVGDGEVLLNKGYGYADVETQTPVDADKTLFAMASISKTITAAAVMQQVEQGKLDLQADIQTYLGGVTIPNETDQPVTMHDLLTHTSGFNRGEGDLSLGMPKESLKTLGQFVEQSMPTVVREPGTVYRYDNFAFTLQGYILEKLTGIPYEDVIKQQIFEPLGMENSGFGEAEQLTDRIASAYDSSGNKIEAYQNGLSSAFAPTGGLVSTGADMAKFMLAMLGEGETTLLTSDSLAKMQTVQFGMSEQQPISSYGMEFFNRQSYNGEAVVGKGGDLYGFHSYMWLMPEHNVGVMFTANTDVTASYDGIFKAFMDHYYPKTADATSDLASTLTDSTSLTAEELAKYEGVYRNLRQPFFYSTVTAGDGILEFQSNQATNFRLNPSGQDTFRDLYGNLTGFQVGADGQADYLYADVTRDTWYERIPDFVPYADVEADNPYADSIEMIRLIGASTEENEVNFGPEESVTRSEFVGQLAYVSNGQLVNTPSRFKDAAEDPNADAIELLAEMGGITGYPDGTFRPEQPITREEAALIVFRVAYMRGDMSTFKSDIAFSNPPSTWANKAVQFMIDAQLSGPEVQRDEAGTYDYYPTDPLLRQEAALTLVQLASVVNQ